MSDSPNTLERLVAAAGQLYSLPAVAMQVLELTENPQVDTRALKECIENDPALTGRILRVVNSSLFGLSREVSDLNQALALLGTKPLKLLVLGFSLPSGMFLGIEGTTLAWYWRRTLTKAVAARELSERYWKIAGDEAFIAGLLQDIGVLLLLQQLGEPYARFLEKVISRKAELGRFEVDALGFPHTTLSARLLEHWRLPAGLVEAVAWQPGPQMNDPSAPDEGRKASLPVPPLAQILHLGELMARLLVDGEHAALGQLAEAGRIYHGLSAGQFEDLIEELEGKVQQLASVLSLQLPDGLEYRDVLAEAHRQLAQVAGQAAEILLQGGMMPRQETLEEDWLLDDVQELAQAVSTVWRRPLDSNPPGSERKAAAPRGAGSGSAPRAETAVCRANPSQIASVANPELVNRLAVAVATCRQSRRPLSLLLVELTHMEDLRTSLGPDRFESLRKLLETVCRRLDHPLAEGMSHGEAGFAVILLNCERQTAVALGDEIIRTMRHLASCGSIPSDRPIHLAVGAATLSLPLKNFAPQDLLAGADRCLYSSHASGGNVVRSIEIY